MYAWMAACCRKSTIRTEQMRVSWSLFGMEDHDGGGGGLDRCSTSCGMMAVG